MSTIDDLLKPPDDAAVSRAIEDFARNVRADYGDRIRGIYLFGSRARGSHRPESDADIAVVISGEDWDYWAEKSALTDRTYDFLIDSGADLQIWPIKEQEWLNPVLHHNPAFVEDMQRDAIPIVARR